MHGLVERVILDRASARGRGKITIHFGNHEEFDHLRAQLTDALNGTAPRRAA